MKLISPVDSLQELQGLIAAGADELYGGVVPPVWLAGYGRMASINQRTFAGAQIDDFDEFLEIIRDCRQADRPFFLTLNSPFYIEEQHSLLTDLVGLAAEAGLAGVILADLGLLRLLVRQFPRLEYHASTLAHLGNSEAVRLYARAGFKRVVLPRHLTTAEMARIVSHVPEVGFDAFLLVGKCPNTEGFCSFHHSSQDKIWPCEIPYKYKVLDSDSSGVLESAIKRQDSWSRSNRRHGCGLCAIPQLAAAGMTGLKLVGRGAPTAMKLANLILAGDFLRLAQQGPADGDYREQAVAAHRRRFGTACSPNVCYYPEFYQGE